MQPDLSHNGTETLERISQGISLTESWGWAFLFVSVINMSSVMGIIFFPLMNKSFYTLVMRGMIGLAVGSLSGSSLFHLIPAAFDLGETNAKGQHYIHIALFIWLAIWVVMMLECVIKIVVKTRAKNACKKLEKKSLALEEDHHSDLIIPNVIIEEDDNKIEEEESEEDDNNTTPTTNSIKTSLSNMPIFRSTFSLNKTPIVAEDKEDKRIKTVAWIIIIGDSLHNFIDGVSIGAGFIKDFRTGTIISLAIMCEEFPHELGDFAILINSGFSVKKALIVNFLSALTCYLGMALGLLLGEIEWANYIFAFASGIFLYVSLADMIPEITSLVEEMTDVGGSSWEAWKVLLTHNIGIFTGISILFFLAAFQPQQS